MDQRRQVDGIEAKERGFDERQGPRAREAMREALRCGVAVHGRNHNYKCGAVAHARVTRTGFATIVCHACREHAMQLARDFPQTTTVEWLPEAS